MCQYNNVADCRRLDSHCLGRVVPRHDSWAGLGCMQTGDCHHGVIIGALQSSIYFYNNSSADDTCFQPVSISQSHSHRPAYSLHSSLLCPSHRMLFLWFIINCICQFGWWETTKYFSPAKYFTSPHNGVQFNNELLCIPAARGGAGAGAGHCSDCTSHSHCRHQQNLDTVTPRPEFIVTCDFELQPVAAVVCLPSHSLHSLNPVTPVSPYHRAHIAGS